MGQNQKIILDTVVDDKRADIAPTMSESDFFEMFVCEQVLKDYELSYEEIESGLMGAGGDGGIDGLYVFLNGELIREDTEISAASKNLLLELIVVQAKTSASFKESTMDKFIATSKDLLDLSTELDTLSSVYNSDLLAGAQIFRKTFSTLASRFPEIKIVYYYATTGTEVHDKVHRKATILQKEVKEHFQNAAVETVFIGAAELLELARRGPKTTYTLRLAENPISAADDGFVCLTRLADYYDFVTNEKGELLRSIFEENVRDYQGSTQVNNEIQNSLRNRQVEDFWWLNNGVTVVALNATHGSKMLTIEEPQIVNGLQTSREIHKYFHKGNPQSDDRMILVRVVVPSKAAVRDRIIKATNSQTQIPLASLRATDGIHRDIEEYLRQHGFFYDRRKNYYKNDGKPLDKILSIAQLAQTVIAVAMQQPDTARARPSSLLKKDDDYKNLFDPEHPIALYLVCASLLKKLDTRLKARGATPGERNNLRYHAAMHCAALAVGKAEPTFNDIAGISLGQFGETMLDASIEAVTLVFKGLGSSDAVAKGSNYVTNVKASIAAALASRKPRPD